MGDTAGEIRLQYCVKDLHSQLLPLWSAAEPMRLSDNCDSRKVCAHQNTFPSVHQIALVGLPANIQKTPSFSP